MMTLKLLIILILSASCILNIGAGDDSSNQAEEKSPETPEETENIGNENQAPIDPLQAYVMGEQKFRAMPVSNLDYSEFPTRRVNDFAKDSTGKEYYATEFGLVVQNGSGGYSTLTSEQLGIPSNVKKVFIDSQSNIYVSSQGAISVSKDGGSTWSGFALKANYRWVVEFVELPTGSIAAVAGYDKFLYISNDRGVSWDGSREIKDAETNTFINDPVDIDVDSNGNIYVIGTSTRGGLYISKDNGYTFKRYLDMSVHTSSVYISDSDEVFVTVQFNAGRGLYKMSGSVDAPIFTKIVDEEIGIDFIIHNNTYYFATGSSGLLISRSVDGNGDRVWENSGLDSSTPNFIFDEVTNIVTNANDVYFMGDGGNGISKTSDGALTFSKNFDDKFAIDIPGNDVTKFAVKDSNNNIYLMGKYKLLKTTDGGDTFTEEVLPVSDTYFAVNIDSQDNLYVARARTIYKKQPTDNSFSNFKSFTPQIFAMYIDSNDVVWVGTSDGLSNSSDNFTTLLCNNRVDQVIANGNSIFAKGCGYSTDSGVTWSDMDFDNDSNADWGLYSLKSNGDVYFSSSSYDIVSTDNGQNWSQVGDGKSAKFNFDNLGKIYYIKGKSLCKMDTMSSEPVCFGGDHGLTPTPREILFGANGIEFVYTSTGLFKYVE